MFEGWFKRYSVNRPLRPDERIARLSRIESAALMPVDKGLLEVNSTYAEYADRFFLLRGWGIFGLIFSAALALPGIYIATSSFVEIYRGEDRFTSGQYVIQYAFALALIAAATLTAKWTTLRDAFTYTYSPIRFNRIEREIYVFNGDHNGGVLTIDWDNAFLFMGRTRPAGGGHQDWTYDLRCHVLDDNEVVRHTFAIGHHCGNSKAELLQHWEMIRLYMEEGPQALPFPPLALYLSPEPTLRNAFIIQVGGMGDGWLRVMAATFTVPWAVARYLALKTCKRPKWPSEIEEACRIDPEDPYRLPQPRFAGDAQTSGPDGDVRYFAYIQHAADEAVEHDEALDKSSEMSA